MKNSKCANCHEKFHRTMGDMKGFCLSVSYSSVGVCPHLLRRYPLSTGMHGQKQNPFLRSFKHIQNRLGFYALPWINQMSFKYSPVNRLYLAQSVQGKHFCKGVTQLLKQLLGVTRVYNKNWLLEETLQITHWMILGLFTSISLSVKLQTWTTQMTSQVPSSSGFLLRITLQLCKDRNVIIAAYFFSPSYMLHRMVLLFSAQENENLELTSLLLSLTKALLVTH